MGPPSQSKRKKGGGTTKAHIMGGNHPDQPRAVPPKKKGIPFIQQRESLIDEKGVRKYIGKKVEQYTNSGGKGRGKAERGVGRHVSKKKDMSGEQLDDGYAN